MSGQPGPPCVVQGVTSCQVTAQWGGEEPQCKIGVLLAERRACTPCHAVSHSAWWGAAVGVVPGWDQEKVSLLVSSPCKWWPIPLNPRHRVRGCVCGGSHAARGGGIAPNFIQLMLSLPLPRRVATWQEASDLGGQWVASRESLFPSTLHSPGMWQQGQFRADRGPQWWGGREVPGRPLRAGDAVDQTAASGRLDLRGKWSLSPETKQTDAPGVEGSSFQQGPVEKSAGGPGAFRLGKAAREAT